MITKLYKFLAVFCAGMSFQAALGTTGTLQFVEGVPFLFIEAPCFDYSLAERLDRTQVDGTPLSVFEMVTDVQKLLAEASQGKTDNERQACGGLGFGLDPEYWTISVYGKELELYTMDEIRRLIAYPGNVVQVDVRYTAAIY